MLHKGTLFWYKARKKKYAALILDIIGSNEYYLVLLSEEFSCENTIDAIMELPVYTAAWFNSFEMLPLFRIHLIAEVFCNDNFNGYAGGFFSDKTVVVNNCGQSKTWRHEFRQLVFQGEKMNEQMNRIAYARIS